MRVVRSWFICINLFFEIISVKKSNSQGQDDFLTPYALRQTVACMRIDL